MTNSQEDTGTQAHQASALTALAEAHSAATEAQARAAALIKARDVAIVRACQSGLSGTTIAARLGVHQQQVSRWSINGRRITDSQQADAGARDS